MPKVHNSLMCNLAFIDGQNLYISTTQSEFPWKVDLVKFRVYLKYKYKVKKAYYFLGYLKDSCQWLYEEIQSAGFILVFRQHSQCMLGVKKGNVDSEIIFQVMEKLYKKEIVGGVLLVSGDGDYKSLADFLIKEKKFVTILFPNRTRTSSLYKKIDSNYKASLDDLDLRRKIS